MGGKGSFRWHEGYGALTLAHRDLERVTEYICNQKDHHRVGSLLKSLERWGDEDPPTSQYAAPG